MAIRKNKKRIDPRYFLDEKMQIPTPVIQKCLELVKKLERGPSKQGKMTYPGSGPHYPEFADQTPEEAEIAQAAYDEIQTQFDDHRCMDTLERAEAYGDIEHNPLDNDPYGPSSNYPGKMKLKR
jgi:hypothetical protein|tara:strand:+ start:561 stop:932 length:372 start_codon:yes stop_codon:yes gene_type:complete